MGERTTSGLHGGKKELLFLKRRFIKDYSYECLMGWGSFAAMIRV
jgi:hypothetical protein